MEPTGTDDRVLERARSVACHSGGFTRQALRRHSHDRLFVGIVAGSLTIETNTVPPASASADWTLGPISWRDRALYATLSGGVSGKDYLLTWTAIDTNGNIWPRTVWTDSSWSRTGNVIHSSQVTGRM